MASKQPNKNNYCNSASLFKRMPSSNDVIILPMCCVASSSRRVRIPAAERAAVFVTGRRTYLQWLMTSPALGLVCSSRLRDMKQITLCDPPSGELIGFQWRDDIPTYTGLRDWGREGGSAEENGIGRIREKEFIIRRQKFWFEFYNSYLHASRLSGS